MKKSDLVSYELTGFILNKGEAPSGFRASLIFCDS